MRVIECKNNKSVQIYFNKDDLLCWKSSEDLTLAEVSFMCLNTLIAICIEANDPD